MSILGAIAGIAGGLLSKPKDPFTPAQNIASSAKGARDAGAKYGFNPLTLLGLGGSYPGTAGNPMLGAAIADAGMLLADKLATNSTAQKLDQYQAQNQKLREQVTQLTLRPKVAGIYAQREAMPSRAAAMGASNARSSGADPADGSARGADQYNWLDPEISSSSDDDSRVPRKPLYFGGLPLRPQSGTSDAEAYEARYGSDFLSPGWFAGWYAFGRDTYKGVADSVDDVGHSVYRKGQDAATRWRKGMRDNYVDPNTPFQLW